MPEYIIDDIDISPDDSDREDSDEESSNEESFNEEIKFYIFDSYFI